MKTQNNNIRGFVYKASEKQAAAYSLKENPTYEDVLKVFNKLDFDDRANLVPRHPDSFREVPDDMLFDRQVAIDGDGNPVGFNEFYYGRDKLGRRQPPHNSIAVVPEARGNGLARLMVEAAVRKAKKKKIKRLVWEAFADNDPSIRAALSAGFKDATPKNAKEHRRFVYRVPEKKASAKIDIPSVYDEVRKAYAGMGYPVSGDRLVLSEQPTYVDGRPVPKDVIRPNSSGGNAQDDGTVRINPRYRAVMRHWGLKGSGRDFLRTIIGHELGHHIDRTVLSGRSAERRRLLREISRTGFHTVYTDSYGPDTDPRKLDKELLAEYLAAKARGRIEKRADKNTLMSETARAAWADLTRTHPSDRTAADLSPAQQAAFAKAWSVDGDGIYHYNAYAAPLAGSSSNAFSPGYWFDKDPNHQVEKLFGRGAASWTPDGDLVFNDTYDLDFGGKNLPGVPTNADPDNVKIRSRISARGIGLDPKQLWATSNARIQRQWAKLEPTMAKVRRDIGAGTYRGQVDPAIAQAQALQARYNRINSGPYQPARPSTLATWKHPYMGALDDFSAWADSRPAAGISTGRSPSPPAPSAPPAGQPMAGQGTLKSASAPVLGRNFLSAFGGLATVPQTASNPSDADIRAAFRVDPAKVRGHDTVPHFMASVENVNPSMGRMLWGMAKGRVLPRVSVFSGSTPRSLGSTADAVVAARKSWPNGMNTAYAALTNMYDRAGRKTGRPVWDVANARPTEYGKIGNGFSLNIK